MHVRRTPLSLPGYEGYGCIEITYSFRPGRDRVRGTHSNTLYNIKHANSACHVSVMLTAECSAVKPSQQPVTLQNGRHFSTHGFPRVCYLPDCTKGQKVMRLLQVAWDRRLTFTIGTSVTTGANNTIVWNEIHHKTECHGNASGHGYPDPNYLDNVLMELESQGVTDDDQD